MMISSNRKPHLVLLAGLTRPRWAWALLAASGCMQWPSLEEGWRPAAAGLDADRSQAAPGAALASAEAAQLQAKAPGEAEAQDEEAQDEPQVEPPADGVLWQTRLGTALAALAAAGLSSAGEGVVFAAGTAAEGSAPTLAGAVTDAWLAAHSSLDGAPLWARQLGTPDSDAARATASRGERVLLAGETSGALEGDPRGFGDAFVAAYSTLGEPLWVRQLGSSAPDAALGVSLDASGAALVVGETRGALDGARSGGDRDAFLAKLGADGELVFTRQLGSSPGYDERAAGVAADDGDIVVVGHTFGDLAGESGGSADAFVARYSGAGELLWTAQHGGEGYDAAQAVAVDSGASYVTGQTGGWLAGGPGVVIGGRPLLAKYSATGERLWAVELPDAEMGEGTAVAVDARGDVWLAGRTSASLAAPSQGAYDSFVVRFSADGERRAALQPAVADSDGAVGLALDGERLLLLTAARPSAAAEPDYALLSGLDAAP